MADKINGTLYTLHSNMRRLREDGPREGQNFAEEAAKINARIREAEAGVDPAVARSTRAAAYAGKRETNSKGGMLKKKKTQMMRGGMANGKQHMYAAGGSVSENPGLKALKASGPKGIKAYNKIMGN